MSHGSCGSADGSPVAASCAAGPATTVRMTSASESCSTSARRCNVRTRPLRVALVYDDSLDRFGGIPQYIAVLGGALTRAGHDVSLLVGETTIDAARGCRVHSLARNVHVRFNGNRLSMP